MMIDWRPISEIETDDEVLVWGIWAGEINGIDDTPAAGMAMPNVGGMSDYAGVWNFVGTRGEEYTEWCRAERFAHVNPPVEAG